MATGRPDIITASGRVVDIKWNQRTASTVSVAYRCRDGHVVLDSISCDYMPIIVTDREVVARFNTVTRGSI